MLFMIFYRLKSNTVFLDWFYDGLYIVHNARFKDGVGHKIKFMMSSNFISILRFFFLLICILKLIFQGFRQNVMNNLFFDYLQFLKKPQHSFGARTQ